ncbi:MAG TPA: VWA domain-containing protein [Vicinamibacterales bacterium]|nr:VWA domain-containing protein [Vicinamibacterales bacterium]
MHRRLTLLVVLLASVNAALAQSQQQPAFRAGRATVAVPVSVFDAYGNVRTDLGQRDFRIFDNGQPQEITNFSKGEVPITALVLIDTSASMTAGLELARHAAEQFVIRLRPGDRARIGSFSNRLTVTGRFTDDRDELLRAVREELPIGNLTRLFDAVGNGLSVLQPEPGRRVLLVLTDGCDTASDLRLEALLDRIRGEDVLLYTVQIASPVRLLTRPPRGRPLDCTMLETQFLSGDSRPSIGTSDARRTMTPDQIAGRLTSETGGGRFGLRPTDDANSTFTFFMNELHHQYLLGFAPPQQDGLLHAIRVDVTRPSLVVRARRSYRADGPTGR